MKYKAAMGNYLKAAIAAFEKLSTEEIERMSEENFEIQIKFIKKQASEKKQNITDENYPLTINKLNSAKSRQEGLEILESAFKSKTEMELFSRHIDVPVIKGEKLERLKTKIVDSTVGAKLRSEAIQGKEIQLLENKTDEKTQPK